LQIGPGEHVLIVGQNRSGKSTLASRIAGAWSRVLVLDPKLDPAAVLPNSHVAVGVADALAHLPGRVIYRPTPAELDDLPGAFTASSCMKSPTWRQAAPPVGCGRPGCRAPAWACRS
jgi:alcohol dehydrogenase YqhD (iron-dependent ADH family)